MRYFGFHPEKGGYWYSFRNMFIVLFVLVAIGTIANLFDKKISWEGIIELVALAIIIYGLNLMRKRRMLKKNN